MSEISSNSPQFQPLEADASGRESSCAFERSRRYLAAGVLTLLVVGGTGLVAVNSGLYSDDWHFQRLAHEAGIWETCEHYVHHMGAIRPLNIFWAAALHKWLSVPVIHLLLVGIHLLNGILVYKLVERISGNRAVAMLSAAFLLVCYTGTDAIVWIAAAQGILPATAMLLGALIAYHEYLARTRRWSMLGLAAFLFGMSLAFYDQAILTPLAFTALAWLTRRRMASSWPFWLIALCVGVTSVLTSAGTDRPLELALSSIPDRILHVIREFFRYLASDPVASVWHRSGYMTEAAILFEHSPKLLIGGAVLVLLGASGLAVYLRKVIANGSDRDRVGRTIALGCAMTIALTMVMALRSNARVDLRHTYLAWLGLAILFAGLAGWAMRRWRRATPPACAAVVVAWGILQLVSGYSWIEGRRVIDHILASLPQVYAAPADGDHVIIDGLLGYGRGFVYSWDLTHAVSLHTGKDVTVATVVRVTSQGVEANYDWDNPWKIDPLKTRFFRWDRNRFELAASSWEEFAERHSLTLPSKSAISAGE